MLKHSEESSNSYVPSCGESELQIGVCVGGGTDGWNWAFERVRRAPGQSVEGMPALVLAPLWVGIQDIEVERSFLAQGRPGVGKEHLFGGHQCGTLVSSMVRREYLPDWGYPGIRSWWSDRPRTVSVQKAELVWVSETGKVRELSTWGIALCGPSIPSRVMGASAYGGDLGRLLKPQGEVEMPQGLAPRVRGQAW